MKTSSVISTKIPVGRHDPLEWAHRTGESAALLKEIKAQLRVKKRQRVRVVTSAAAAACLAFVLLWVVPWWRHTAVMATVAGQREHVMLADGSQVELNAQTELHADLRYGRRTVRLVRGEAFFSVATDAAHPFLVETPHGTVRVTGTRFNVRLGAGQLPEVSLLEGAVEIQRAKESDQRSEEVAPSVVRLTPGEQFSTVAGSGEVRTLSPLEIERLTAWRQGRIVLEGRTLGDALAAFAAHHGTSIDVSPVVANLKMGGVYPLDDLNDFLGSLEEALPVKVWRDGQSGFRVAPR
ncbi:FecR family protein [Oleiharenicola lentus]|uniref:FecR family protein n=1 Tax=Oleiharenicola lentus TaxID=2508720 RepID=UPI003F67E69A